MDYQAAIQYLSQYTNYERELRYPYNGWAMNLSRVRALLDELSYPERGLPVVHIAGTKGKGSVAAMVESMVRASGRKTGLFTSPHLLDFRERIRLSGELVSQERVGQGVERIMKAAEKVKARRELGALTYFEILTALAFWVFSEEKVELAVLETGLGGRFDATNICEPLVSVLTPISLDHTDILGPDLASIAAEKAMIIKPGRPAVIAPQPTEAAAVFHARCEEVGAREVRVEELWTWSRKREEVRGQWFDLFGSRLLKDLFLPLVGDHQLINAATALTTMEVLSELGIATSDEERRRGLAAVSWPARFERVGERPEVILDGAHNAASAAYLRETLQRLYPGRRVIGVIGLGQDKDVTGFCRELAPALSVVILTRSQAMKAAPASLLRSAFSDFPVVVHEATPVAAAFTLAQEVAGREDVIVITGSFYVISDFLSREL